MVGTVQKCHYEALKTLKMLCFLALCQWNLPGSLQLPGAPNCIDNLLSRIEDHHPM